MFEVCEEMHCVLGVFVHEAVPEELMERLHQEELGVLVSSEVKGTECGFHI